MATGENTHPAGDPRNTSRPGPSTGAHAASAGARSLEECRTGPYLIGRLVGLACHLADHRRGARCDRYAHKIAGGGVPPAAGVIATLNGMLGRDLARPGTPAAYQTAVADIAGRLGELEAWPALPWPPASLAAAQFVLGQHHQAKALSDALAERG
jgi:hypothetical protein